MLVKNLPQQVGLDIRPEIKELFLYCVICHSRCSANKGDYFMASDNHDLMCCGESLGLCRSETKIIPVQPEPVSVEPQATSEPTKRAEIETVQSRWNNVKLVFSEYMLRDCRNRM